MDAKQAARQFLEQRARNPQPIPTIEEIRRQLGWFLIPKQQKG